MVPAVFMIKLLAIELTLPALQVPVPVNTSVEVPPIPAAPPVVAKLPVILMVFPFNPILPDGVFSVRFVIVMLFGKVVVPPPLANIAPVGLKVFTPAENVKVVVPSVNNPVILRFDNKVKITVLPPVEKLFQIIPPVLRVVDAATFKVDPVTITVPAV